MTESPTHPPAVRPVAAFIVLMGVADAWLVAWWIGSVWVMAVAAGILSGLFVVIALTIRRDLPAVSVGDHGCRIDDRARAKFTEPALFGTVMAAGIRMPMSSPCEKCFHVTWRRTHGGRRNAVLCPESSPAVSERRLRQWPSHHLDSVSVPRRGSSSSPCCS